MLQQSLPKPGKRPANRSAYLSEDTIVALATSLGGAIAILRVSGPSTRTVLRHMTGLAEFEPRKFYKRTLKSRAGVILDEALVVFFCAPGSYTGEDVSEIHLHGSSYVVRSVMDELRAQGVRQALPGEFSFRAVRNGKLTLSEAHGVADLVESGSAEAARLALEKLSGAQNGLMRELSDGLRDLAASAELGIDFSDQDVVELQLPRLKERLEGLLKTLRRLEASFARGAKIQNGISVAILGEPNVGKSSFFNALLGEDRSIVSSVAGTTRDLIREKLTLGNDETSLTFRVIDTAGLRETNDQVERIGVERSRAAEREADLTIRVLDATGEDFSPSPASLIILAKVDLLDQIQRAQLRARVPRAWKWTSAKTSEGIAEVAAGLVGLGQKIIARASREVILTRLDHHDACVSARQQLERALGAGGLEFFAADVRQALASMTILVGETLPDDLLGRIFSRFCIGK